MSGYGENLDVEGPELSQAKRNPGCYSSFSKLGKGELMKKQILNIAELDQVSDVPYPWAIVVSQIKEGEKIYYAAEICHERFIRRYSMVGFTWQSGRQFVRWLDGLFTAFEYSPGYYPVELFPRDLRFAEVWFDRHFMRSREDLPAAI